ncbi:MAG TPA: Rid family hydrolase [Herpetosiphonaceae bacterium]
MSMMVETFIPANTPTPIGPYSHIAKAGPLLMIGGTAGFDPATNQLRGTDIATQTTQILANFAAMLATVDSDLRHVLHITVFLMEMSDFAAMNEAYSAAMGDHRPARTVVGVQALPKPGVLVTMNLTAVTSTGWGG